MRVEDVRLSALMNPTDKQREALRLADRFRYLLYGGAGGGGKSYLLRWWCLRQLLRFFGELNLSNVRVGLFSRDYPTLTDRQISRIGKEFPDWLGKLADSREDGLGFKLKPEFGSGFIALRNLDDPSKYKSAEFAAIGIEEVTEISKADFDDLRFRLRWPSVERPSLVACSNPDGPGHAWVKDLWIDGKLPRELEPMRNEFKFLPALVKDNPHLPQSYYDELSSLPTRLRKARRDGDWSTPEGQYFTCWERGKQVIAPHVIAQIVQPWWSHWIAMDWGFRHACAIYWFATGNVMPEQAVLFGRTWESPRKCTFVYRELVVTLSDEETEVSTELQLAQAIAKHTSEPVNFFFLGPDAFGRKSSNNPPATVIAAELYRLNKANNTRIPAPTPAVDDRVPGWRFCYQQIVADTLFVSEFCPELIEAIPILQYADADGAHPEDIEKTTHVSDDCADAWRYGVFSMLGAAKRPMEVAIQEQQAAIKDPMELHFARLRETQRREALKRGRNYWE